MKRPTPLRRTTPPEIYTRFVALARAADAQSVLHGGSDDFKHLASALPAAQALVLFGNPLDANENEPLGSYIEAEWTKARATFDTTAATFEEDFEQRIVAERAVYFVAFNAGLLVADQLNTRPPAAYHPTPIERFVDLLQTVQELQGLTDHGLDALRANLRIALPFLPAIIGSGQWADWTEGPVNAAVTAIAAARIAEPTGRGPDADDVEAKTAELEAHYLTGLLTGLGLAHALDGARGGQ